MTSFWLTLGGRGVDEVLRTTILYIPMTNRRPPSQTSSRRVEIQTSRRW